jgi:predicted dithiol-disulfide oxidoreductase (DUF899 family)
LLRRGAAGKDHSVSPGQSLAYRRFRRPAAVYLSSDYCLEVIMSLPTVVSRDEWLVARRALLAREKEATRAHDALNTARRELPMVRVGKPYEFDGPDGRVGLADLFAGHRQLVVQHFMFNPAWEDGCGGCTAVVDEISDGLLRHLRSRDTNYAVVARAPLAKIDAYRSKRGWTIPIYSSNGSDFNYDFHVTLDASVAPIEFNYRTPDELRAAGMEWVLDTEDQPMEQPGYSCFVRDGDAIFHTYSTFGRGTEVMAGAYGVLDLTALGRQEDWEEPKGRVDKPHGADPSFSSVLRGPGLSTMDSSRAVPATWLRSGGSSVIMEP